MSLVSYTKLDSGIVHSTVWEESHPTRIVWITMLALADRHGEVMGSVPGLAHMARVTVEECREALTRFLSPDADSRTKTFSGRRIQEIPGGWFILNHAEHRRRGDIDDRRQKARERQQRHRAKARDAFQGTLDPSLAPLDASVDPVTQKRDIGVTGANVSRDVTELPYKQLSSKQSSDTELQDKTTTSARTSRRSWLTPFWDKYREHYPDADMKAVCGQLARYLAPLAKKHPLNLVEDQLDKYLRQTPADFLSLSKFAQGYGKWTGRRGKATTQESDTALSNYRKAGGLRGLTGRSSADAEPVHRVLPPPRRRD